ncbi:MAG: hypothetical protein RL318_1238 [Fibrobacterota bacterium]|jgi:protein TonB
MRRDPSRVRRTPDLSVLTPREVLFPKVRHRTPTWLKIALACIGLGGLVLLSRLDFGTGQNLSGRKAPPAMLQVEVPPPPAPKPETPSEVLPVPQELPVPTETPQMPSLPSVGILQDADAGGSGNGLPGPALDLGVASGRGGMGVVTGGGGSGGGIGTGTGSGAGSGTATRFVYNPGETDTDPQLVTSGDPTYPRRAREDGVEPRVELRILVDERGRVEQVEVQGAPAGYGFEAVLRTAVQQWRFQPATKGGVPVRTWVSQGYQFRLN